MAVQIAVRYVQRLRGFSANARLYLLNDIIIGLSFSIYALLLNLYIVSAGYSRSTLGGLQALPNLIALFAAMPAGTLVDAVGRKRGLLLANVLRTFSMLGLVLAQGPGWLRLSMLMYGLATSLATVSGAPFMMENSTEEERTTLFSAHFGVATLAGFLGTLAGGALPTLFGGALRADVESTTAYRATLSMTVLLCALSLLPVLLIRDRRQPDTEVRSVWPWQNLSHPGLVARILLPNLVIAIGASLLIPYLNLFFKETFATSDKALGALFAVSAVITGTATLASPVLADHWGRIRSLVMAQIASIPFLLAIGFAPVFWVAAGAFWVRAALMNMVSPLYDAFAMEQVSPRERATLSGLCGMSLYVGWTIGPLISGAMQDHAALGFRPMFLLTCSLYLLAAILSRTFFQRMDDKQRWEATMTRHDQAHVTAG